MMETPNLVVVFPLCPGKSAKLVFAPDVPGIHVFGCKEGKTWMAVTSTAMTMKWGGLTNGSAPCAVR